jgi:tetratricopeptide (TPR) repeat protein
VVKKAVKIPAAAPARALALALALALFSGACATMAPRAATPMEWVIEDPAAAATAALSLDDRITVQEAWNHLRQGRADRARKVMTRWSQMNPFYFPGLGYAALLEGDLAGAEANFQAAVQRTPDMVLAHVGLGQAYQKAGRPEAAFKSYLEALKYEPDHTFAGREAESLRTRLVETTLAEAAAAAGAGRMGEAKESYLNVLEYAPKLQDAHLALARIYLKEKNTAGALFHLKTANANDPKDTAVLRDYAEALFQSNQIPRGLEIYERLVELDPQDKAARDRLETLKTRLGIVDVPSQYQAISGLAAVTKEDVSALIAVKFRDFLAQAEAKPPVIVDITTSWARSQIVKVASLGILEVYANHTFQPTKTLTRGEMAEAIVRLVDQLKRRGAKIVAQIPLDRIRIADVPQEHSYFQSIAQIVSYQVMDLAADGNFKPELTMSGAEAIKVLDLVAGLAK